MFIAAIGAYVLATDAVQRRTREIALRKLFGARRRDVGRLVAKEIGAVIAAGCCRGIAARGARHRAISRAVLGTHADRVLGTGVAVAAALGVVGIAAARQARIAMRMKPAVALRT